MSSATNAEERALADVTPPIALGAFASLVVALNASFMCTGASAQCTGVTAYALAAGALSLGAAASFLACHLQLGASEACVKVMPYLTITLATWWAVAALVLTSAGPFVSVSNGYVGAWLAAAAFARAAMLASARVRGLAEAIERGYDGPVAKLPFSLAVLGAASTVELIAATAPCAAGGTCAGWHAFAVAAGVVGVVTTAALAFGSRLLEQRVDPRVPLLLSLFACAWWAASTVVLTFVAPFTSASNGFFATWLAAAAAAHFAYEQLAAKKAPPKYAESDAAAPGAGTAADGGAQQQQAAAV